MLSATHGRGDSYLFSNGNEIGLTSSDALSKILLFSGSASKAPLSVVCPIVQDASLSWEETVSDQEETEVVSTPVAAMWSHQDEAIEWFLDPEQADGVGIFQMATGSGNPNRHQFHPACSQGGKG